MLWRKPGNATLSRRDSISCSSDTDGTGTTSLGPVEIQRRGARLSVAIRFVDIDQPLADISRLSRTAPVTSVPKSSVAESHAAGDLLAADMAAVERRIHETIR